MKPIIEGQRFISHGDDKANEGGGDGVCGDGGENFLLHKIIAQLSDLGYRPKGYF